MLVNIGLLFLFIMNSYVDCEQFDIKHEEDPPSIIDTKIKIEPSDIKNEINTEPEEYDRSPDQFDVKHEIHLSPEYVASIKTISEVENMKESSINLLHHEKKPKDEKYAEKVEIDLPIVHEVNQNYKINVEQEKCDDVCNLFVDHEITKEHLINSQLHKQVNKDKKYFTCNECGKSFLKKKHLIDHTRIHTGERPFKCVVCKKSFYGKGGLDRHTRTHTGERPFTCTICNKSFSQKSALQIHMMRHNEQKPFTCSVCNKSFPLKCELANHVLSHTGGNVFPCDVCNRSFIKKNDLTRHIRTHTGEKPYTCNICRKLFNRRGNLARHIHGHKAYDHNSRE